MGEMDWSHFRTWLNATPLWVVGLALFVAMCVAAAVGVYLRRLREGRTSGEEKPTGKDKSEGGQEGYIVSAVLGLLALLMGFTFSLAVDRFDARRHLVIEEANAIGTTYLRVQLLPEPHRSRMSALLVRYTGNRVALAEAPPGPRRDALLASNDALITELWAATAAAFDSVKGLDFSSTFVDGVNRVIDLDASRKAARQARVPAAVFGSLFIYMITTAGVLGYVLKGVGGRAAAAFLLALFTLSLMLIVDIDRPISGGVIEGQGPMKALLRTMTAWPPSTFDRWRAPADRASPAPVRPAPAGPPG
jgi:hypothetical protein